MDPEYTRARESWRGAAYDDVVQAWGPPNRIVQGTPEKHVWLAEDRAAAPRPGPVGGISIGVGASRGNVGVGVGMGGGAMYPPDGGLVRCERTLMIREGVVVGEDWQGDAEFCKRFARR